jgi:HD-like signal output (HDOD) protein
MIEERSMTAEVEMPDRSAERMTCDVAIPPCPSILTKLLRETRSDEPDFRRVGQLIGRDVALASAVVNTANSSYYGLRTKASSVQQAVTLLGLDEVTRRVTGLLLQHAFSGTAGPGMERYWKASMATALIAGLVSRETGRGASEICHTYALFQNCGMPVMLQKFPIYADILDGSALAFGDPVLEIEEERYATNHAKIGAQLAQSWHLSEPLCQAIRHHHDLPASAAIRAQVAPETRVLVAIGLAAEQIYCSATADLCHDWAQADEWVFEELGLTPEKLTEAAGRFKTLLAQP